MVKLSTAVPVSRRDLAPLGYCLLRCRCATRRLRQSAAAALACALDTPTAAALAGRGAVFGAVARAVVFGAGGFFCSGSTFGCGGGGVGSTTSALSGGGGGGGSSTGGSMTFD